MNLLARPETLVEPIGTSQQARVVALTYDYIRQGSAAFGISLSPIPVKFDLRGRAAGMYRVRDHQPEIRYNPYLFAKYFEDNLALTVPHEVAHYVAHMLNRPRRVRPHGPEWREVMRTYGLSADVTCAYDLRGVPVRRERRYAYRCDCARHDLTRRRHNQISDGRVRCLCRNCGALLVPLNSR